MRRLRLSIMSAASSIVPRRTRCTMGSIATAPATATACAALIGEVAAAGVTVPMSGTMASTEEGAGTAEAGEHKGFIAGLALRVCAAQADVQRTKLGLDRGLTIPKS